MLSNEQLNRRNESELKKGLFPSSISFAPEEADMFLDYVWDQSVWKNHVRFEKMTKAEKTVHAVDLGTGNILYPASVFTTANYKTGVTAATTTLTSKKARGCIFIPDDDLEDNPEGEAFVDHLLRMMSVKIANELDKSYYVGSGETNPTTLNEMVTGIRHIIKNADTEGDDYYNAVTGASVILDASDTDVFSITTGQHIAEQAASGAYNIEYKHRGMLKNLDSKYKLNNMRKSLRFFANDDVVEDYVWGLQQMGVQVSAELITGAENPPYRKIPMVAVPQMPTEITSDAVLTGGEYTDCLLTHAGNIVIGIQRQLKMEPERSARDEGNYFFFSIRFDLKIFNPNACVLLENLKVRPA